MAKRHGADPWDDLETLHAEDLFLAWAVLREEPCALRELMQLIDSKVRADVTRVLADDVHVDEVLSRLLSALTLEGSGGTKKLEQYTGRGPLAAWIRTVGMGTAINFRRQLRASINLEDPALAGEDFQIASENQELRALRTSCGALFTRAFRHALGTLSSRERTLLRLRFIDGLTLDELASFQGIHRATAVRWLAELSSRLRRQVQMTLTQSGALDPQEADSLVRTARQGSVFSLRQLLRDASLLEAPSENAGPGVG
ncbi:MAG: sigma factor-like helix-turn-helix DNA-binding protein [Myxococcaceae bacterium]